MDYHHHEGVLVVRPGEYMDLKFKKEVLPVVRRHVGGAETSVLVDCTDVDLVNSYGISALLSIYDRVTENGGTLAFANVTSPLVENVLEISGLSSFCADHFYLSADEALRSLADSG